MGGFIFISMEKNVFHKKFILYFEAFTFREIIKLQVIWQKKSCMLLNMLLDLPKTSCISAFLTLRRERQSLWGRRIQMVHDLGHRKGPPKNWWLLFLLSTSGIEEKYFIPVPRSPIFFSVPDKILRRHWAVYKMYWDYSLCI